MPKKKISMLLNKKISKTLKNKKFIKSNKQNIKQNSKPQIPDEEIQSDDESELENNKENINDIEMDKQGELNSKAKLYLYYKKLLMKND